MGGLAALASIGVPIAMAFGAIAAWRLSKRENDPESKPAEWRDTSLDDWRRERDEQAVAERKARSTSAKAGVHEATGGDEGEAKRHQRIGG
jgi:hypothetical protein